MHLARGQNFLYQTIQLVVHVELAQASFFSGTKEFLHFANLHATIQVAGFLRSAKVFFQETPAWCQTLAVGQNEYLPQVSRRVEEQ